MGEHKIECPICKTMIDYSDYHHLIEKRVWEKLDELKKEMKEES